MDVEYEDEAVRRSGRDAYLIGASAMYAYSPKGEYFVNVALAVDKHRLRVYDTTTGKSVAEHSVETGRVTSMSWQMVAAELATDAKAATRKKKRKTSKDPEAGGSSGTLQVIALGLSTGSFVFFSPVRDEVVYTSPPANTMSPILAMATSTFEDESERRVPAIWTSSSDGTIKAFNLQTNALVGNWRDADRTPYTCISIRPGSSPQEGETHILAGHHSIRLFAVSVRSSLATGEARTLKPIASFTGHVSPVNTLLWSRPNSSSITATRFISAAEGDRIAQVWDVPSATSKSAQGHVVATIPLDSDVVQLEYLSESQSSKVQPLLALSMSGVVSLYRVPTSLSHHRNSAPLLSLTPQSTISTVNRSSATPGAENLVAAQFLNAAHGHLSVACIVSSRPVFQTVRYLDDSDNFSQEVEVDLSKTVKAAQQGKLASGSRYSEKTAHVHSGLQTVEDLTTGDIPVPLDGELDTEMAEMTLGQRMKIILGATNGATHGGDDDEADDGRPSVVGPSESFAPMTSTTLTRTLTQALHSSDSRLLDTCLQQHDPTIVKETVRHLRQDHVVTLIDELVDRLGRGGSGGKGGASTQQARTTVAWLRAVLLCHTAYLVTRPDLVKRLSALHSVVNARTELQNRLQALSGRLDLVLSQVEMRASTKVASKPAVKRVKTVQYVEGDSSAEDAKEQLNGDANSDVDTEEGDDVGSVEDVELGGESDDDDDEDDDEDEDESGGEHGGMNGFIDDEAEESLDDEESDGDSEEDDESESE
ncbi:Small subunit (SSU) processome component [Tulasnella sp. JGI-2019a]|nr:Small subunit (SSU) processome component [Tulasnella sp. JGI-2019a]KAG9010437.1 Small subunit (SSU) processome component [Tulasnella sp. JGI-2019a]